MTYACPGCSDLSTLGVKQYEKDMFSQIGYTSIIFLLPRENNLAWFCVFLKIELLWRSVSAFLAAIFEWQPF